MDKSSNLNKLIDILYSNEDEEAEAKAEEAEEELDFEIKDGVAIILEGAMEIVERTFKGCTSLESIVIPKVVTMICGFAFEGCTSLTTVTLPAGVKHINYYCCPIKVD